MMETKSKVYALPDAEGRILRIDGGYTIGNIKDIDKWKMIDEGYGDRYDLCQGNYLPKPLTDMRGVYRYKLVDGAVQERTASEMDADYTARPAPPPTDKERITALEEENAVLLECLLEMSEIVYA